jgi:hypothetical protein
MIDYSRDAFCPSSDCGRPPAYPAPGPVHLGHHRRGLSRPGDRTPVHLDAGACGRSGRPSACMAEIMVHSGCLVTAT